MQGLILLVLACVAGTTQAACGSMCCPGRNNTCHAFGHRLHSQGAEILPSSAGQGRCFCDESCVDMKDCCHDYEKSCAAVDCQVSEWSDWSACSKSCGVGMVRRSRSVLVKPRNGGEACPILSGSNICIGKLCRAVRQRPHSGSRVLRETARIMPGSFGRHRTSNQYDYRKDIRQNLFKQYHAQNEIAKPQSCRAFSVVTSKKACSLSSWAHVLRKGQTVCVECQETAMKSELGWRCRGQGQVGRRTYWSANGVSGCHGWWQLQEDNSQCTCTGEKSTDFLFV